MSQAENLLDTIYQEGVPTTLSDEEPHVIVREDRTILVPPELKRIGVQHDHNVETVTFDCVRYWDEHDLSAMDICINFRAANGVPGRYPVTDVTVDSEDPNVMHFTWTIGEDVTQGAGKIAFSICIRDHEDIARATVHWNSETCNDMYVSPGLETMAALLERNPDILTHVLELADKVNNLPEDIASSEEVSELSETVLELAGKVNNLPEDIVPKNVWYGTCTDSAGTSTKRVTTTTGDFAREEGNVVFICFSNAEEASSVKLTIDGTEAVYTSTNCGWGRLEVVPFVYSNNKYERAGWTKATTAIYGAVKLSTAVNSTSTGMAATPSAVKQAYDLANTANTAATTAQTTANEAKTLAENAQPKGDYALKSDLEGLGGGSDEPTGAPKNVWYGVASTGQSSTSGKTITTSTGDFKREVGNVIIIRFQEEQLATNCDFDVDGTGSTGVYRDNTYRVGAQEWSSKEVVGFVYANNHYIMIDGAQASTTRYGVTKLTNAVDSTSNVLAAAASAVKKAYDLANTANTAADEAKTLAENAQPKGDYALRSDIPDVPVQSVNGKTGAVQLTAGDVGAESSGAVPAHNTSEASHNDIRLLISGLTTRLNALANSTDTDLDQLAEVVEYIKANKSLIDSITTSKVNVGDIVDNLSTSVSDKPLSAKMGVQLKSLIDAIKIPTTLPASDVYDWAKQPDKPTYTASEVGAATTKQLEDLRAYIDNEILGGAW